MLFLRSTLLESVAISSPHGLDPGFSAEEDISMAAGAVQDSDLVEAPLARNPIIFDEVYGFVPELIMRALRKRFREPRQLDRVLRPSWVRSWRGWQQARENLEEGLDDPLVFEEAMMLQHCRWRWANKNTSCIGTASAAVISLRVSCRCVIRRCS